MEFLDEEPRPRFVLQSRLSSLSSSPSPSLSSPETQSLNKPFLFLCISLSISLVSLALLFLRSQTLQFLLIWFASSLLLAPFAPPSLTGGDPRVGRGPVVHFPDQDPKVARPEERAPPSRRSRPRKPEEPTVVFGNLDQEKVFVACGDLGSGRTGGNGGNVRWVDGEGGVGKEEREWSDADVELLKKQMLKHPVGKARRWEIVAEAFGGRHRVESVIKMAKALAEKRAGNEDSYVQFLKNRKPLDKRIEDGNVENSGGNGGESWTSGEDIALLNALKAFPKDAAMRWEKIAAAVPGRSKAACMTRVGELKRDFRSSKASAEA